MKWVFLALIFVTLMFGCIDQGGQPTSDEERAKQLCIDACNFALSKGQDLNVGPCLLNPIQEMPNWVCDVAHDPRNPVDNDPSNQCSSFRRGYAKHFVEVKPNCEFIKAI